MSGPAKRRTPAGAGGGAAIAIAAAVLIAAPIGEKWEGYAPRPYLDPAAIKTYCYGETDLAYLEDRIYSKSECGALLRKRLARDYAPRVLACLPQLGDPRRVQVFGALLDASYNAGPVAVCKSRMAIAVRAGRWVAACNAIEGWYVTARNRKTGVRVRLRGLERRRRDEKAVCLKGASLTTA